MRKTETEENIRRMREAKEMPVWGTGTPEAVKGKYTPGQYRDEAKSFLRASMDKNVYDMLMQRRSSSMHTYVIAKMYLSAGDWCKYVWIEHHGSLAGFRE